MDLVIGSRFIGDSEFKSSMMRRVGISIFSHVISMIVRQKITDPTSGFRAANRKAIQLFAFDYPQDYPEPEVGKNRGRSCRACIAEGEMRLLCQGVGVGDGSLQAMGCFLPHGGRSRRSEWVE